MSLIRINKYLSLCGVTSRRGADDLITAGRVTLDGCPLTERGTVVNTDTDLVKVDGVEARPVTEKVYVVLNKPNMTMTTLHDPFKRRTVVDYLRNLPHRVYPVGRLDYDAEGVLLLTNDGDLAFRLAHPRYQVPKIYEAQVEGRFDKEDADRIKRGIKLDDGAIGHAKVLILGYGADQTRLRLLLTEGRKREVKQLCKAVGHPVIRLRRVEFAGIQLKSLRTGQYRHLTRAEISRLRQMVGLV
ncbi:MAG: pseudouridine synthase [Candidatus Zixiibacteriota bacterium]